VRKGDTVIPYEDFVMMLEANTVWRVPVTPLAAQASPQGKQRPTRTCGRSGMAWVSAWGAARPTSRPDRTARW
jgi:hypothetical protein